MAIHRLLGILVALILAGQARAEQVTLRFQYWADIYSKPIFESIVRDFNAAHPDIRVIPELVPGRGYDQKMLIQVAGRTAPDVLAVEVSGFVPLADKDVLLPLDSYVARTPDFDLSGYYPDAVHRFTRHGKLYALPRDVGPVCVVFYNKKLFDEAGLPYPTDDWSWSPDPDRVQKTGMDPNKDFLTVVRKLTKRDPRTGRIRQWGFTGGWENFAYSAGGRLVDNVDEPTRITMDDPRVVGAIQFRSDLTTLYHGAPTTIELESENTTTSDLFQQGRIALLSSGMWESTGFRTIKDFDWDAVKFPKGPTGLRGWHSGGTGFGIMRQCPHPDQAWEFVRYIGGKPGLTALATAGRSMPALKSVAYSPVWLDQQKPLRKGEVVNDSPPFSVYSPFSIAWPRALQVINAELDRVWTGEQTAREAISKSLPLAQKVLDDTRNAPPRAPVPWGPVLIGILVGFMVLTGLMVMMARRELGPHPSSARKRETLAGYLAVSPWLLGFVIFTAGPLAVSLVMAFCQWDAIRPAGWIGFDNFREMFGGDRLVPKALWNTLVFTAVGVPLHTAGALALALLLNTGVRGMRTFRTIYYLPAVTSAVAASVLWKWVFNPDYGLLNWALERMRLMNILDWLGFMNDNTGTVLWLTDPRLAKPALIIMGLWSVGGGMIIYLAGLQGIPRSLYEAAEIDGAGALSRFRNVTLPMLTPTIFFSLIMGVIGSFQVFTQALVMTDGGPANATLFYVLYVYRIAFQDLRMGYASALAWLLFVIILAITLLQFRFSRWVYYEGGAPK